MLNCPKHPEYVKLTLNNMYHVVLNCPKLSVYVKLTLNNMYHVELSKTFNVCKTYIEQYVLSVVCDL